MTWSVKYLGAVRCNALVDALDKLDESAWEEDVYRQTVFANVHAETQSIILIFCEGHWPNMRVFQRSGWKYFGDHVLPVMREIIARHYPAGGMILRAMLARLPAGAKIGRHIDSDASFAAAHRIHVPLRTNSAVEFEVGSDMIDIQVGSAFELNNEMPHKVVNNGEGDRVHFIFDYLPPPKAARQ